MDISRERLLAHPLRWGERAGLWPPAATKLLTASNSPRETNRNYEHSHASAADPMETLDPDAARDGGLGHPLGGVRVELLVNDASRRRRVVQYAGHEPRLRRSAVCRVSALAAAGDGRSLAEPRIVVVHSVFRHVRAGSLAERVSELRARHRLAASVSYRHDAGLGRLEGAAVGLAFDRVPDLHGAAAGLRGRSRGTFPAAHRHHHEHLRPTDAGHCGDRSGRRFERDPTRTSAAAGSRRGVQRPADDDGLLRNVHWGLLRPSRSVVEKAHRGRQRGADRRRFQRRTHHRGGMLQECISPRVGHFFHNSLGVLMVVPAVFLIWGELALIAVLVIEPVTEGPLILARAAVPGGGDRLPERVWQTASAAPVRCPTGRKARRRRDCRGVKCMLGGRK